MNDRARWESLADALALDEDLPEAELGFVQQFDDPWVDEERQVYQQLVAAGVPTEPHHADRARAEATLAAFRRTATPPPSRWSGKSTVVGLGAGLLAVAAAAVVWVSQPLPDAVLAEHSRVSSGVLMVDGVELGSGEALPVDRWVVARDRACVQLRRARGCVSPSTRLRIHEHEHDDGQQLEVADGALEFTGDGEIATPLGIIEAHDGELTVEVTEQGMRLQSRDGGVELRDDDGSVEAVDAGAVITRGSMLAQRDAEPGDDASIELVVEDDDEQGGHSRRGSSRSRAVESSASELLAAARRHVGAGDTSRALTTYASLRRQHPGSPEAHAANVSIGELELRRGRAKSALRAFSRYLSAGGALAEEAHWGKIRALHRLKRTRDRDAAIDALRRAHPSSVYLSRATSL